MLKNTMLWIIRLFVGGLFIFSGLIKVNDPVGTAIKLEEYFDVFSYDIASFLGVFKAIALPLSVGLVVAEVVLGVMLIVGYRLKFTVWALGLMILFFTFLTFYSAYFDKVTDCGCFGDAIKLTPWESFIKDIILLVLIGILFVFRKNLGNQASVFSTFTVGFSLFFSTGLAIYAINNLPFIDFRAYKKGINIAEAMQPSAPLQYRYVMEKDGQQFVFDQYPLDDDYEFIEMQLVNEEALPKISDFAVWGEDGDFTDEVLTGRKVLILVYNMSMINTNHLDKMEDMIQGLKESGISTWLVAASTTEEIDWLLNSRDWDIPGYQGDATVIKTIMRSNPGTMVLEEGVVLDKYHFRNTPSASEILALFNP